ncbi:MAG: sensor histidine kinase [Planctomycetota bacterium]|jgi:signal transduction histidine kinase
MKPRLWSSAIFGLVVATCLAQVAWWIIFQVNATETTEEVARLLEAGLVSEALDELDAGGAKGRRFMFITEGATLGILVLVGIIFFYAAMIRERRLRQDHRRFLQGATHELKSPLATLRIGLESLISGRMPSDKQGKYLDGMIRELERLETGLNNILTAAGIDGGPVLHMSEGDLASDLIVVTDRLDSRFRSAGVQLQLQPLEPCPVERDRAVMGLIIHSLLDNAVKFCAEGDQVVVSLEKQADQAVLRIKDSGAGIDREDLPQIFDRFYRGSNSPHVGGTGLGLYLARELVGAHGGRVEASSQGKGRGSEFIMSLPIKRGAS